MVASPSSHCRQISTQNPRASHYLVANSHPNNRVPVYFSTGLFLVLWPLVHLCPHQCAPSRGAATATYPTQCAPSAPMLPAQMSGCRFSQVCLVPSPFFMADCVHTVSPVWPRTGLLFTPHYHGMVWILSTRLVTATSHPHTFNLATPGI